VDAGGSTAAYVYDAAGQRVRKTSSAGTVDYIYDLAGHEIAEVSSAGAWNRGEVYAGGRHLATYNGGTTYFNHVDWLGTERARSSLAAMLCETVVSLPFGDGQTTNGSCGDPSPMHFTGKERDAETGNDYFGARYFGSNMGRFMSPDAFFKDSHVGDPQSWNEYAYARNNPLRYVDPNGENATVSTNCTTDANNHTTCNVTISATIAIYAAPGSNLTQDQLNQAAGTIQNSIQNAWTGQFNQDGVTYNVNTQVNVSVAASQDAAMSSGAQNVIGMTNGPPMAGVGAYVNPKSLWGALTGAPDTGMMDINNADNYAKHEFTHLLGTYDKPGAVLSDTDPAMRPFSATSQDFAWGIREATSGVNSWVNAPQFQARGFSDAWEKPSVYSDRTTVGAPWHWWK
jgi:RHS repeat-associated protein